MQNQNLNINFFSGSSHCLPILENIYKNQGKILGNVVLEQIKFLENTNLLFPEKKYLKEILEKKLPELDLPIRLNLVVTNPKKEGARKQNNLIYNFTLDKNLPVFTPEKINKQVTEFQDLLQTQDISIVASFGQIVSQAILDSSNFGFINWHPSLLPKYRGASPIQSTLLNGDLKTGLTWINMTAGMDSGEILLQQEKDLTGNENFTDLISEFADLGSKTWALATCQKIALQKGFEKSGQVQLASQATFCKKITKEDRQIEPLKMIQKQIYQHFLAYREFPGTVFLDKYFNQFIKLSKVKPIENLPNGETIFEDQVWLQIKLGKKLTTFLKTQKGLLQIEEVILENGKKVNFSGYYFKQAFGN